jgi:hypothetical protein
VAPKAWFSTTVHIDRKGYSVLHIDRYAEDYLITMPKIHIEGIMTGALTPELSGTTYIRSSSGYTARIDYASKGWVSGKRNSFVATLSRDDGSSGGSPLYVAEGQWSGDFTITHAASRKVVETVRTTTMPTTPLQVAPLAEQHPLESRRAWHDVVTAIERNDYLGVGAAKSKLENAQREMHKREKAAGVDFPRRYFTLAAGDAVAERLAAGKMAGVMDGHHHGLWMWDEEKYRRQGEPVMESAASMTVEDQGTKSATRTRNDSGVGMIEVVS